MKRTPEVLVLLAALCSACGSDSNDGASETPAPGEPNAEPGAAPAFGPGNYSCRLNDPDGYLVEVCVAHQ